jgi:hypothetical protein
VSGVGSSPGRRDRGDLHAVCLAAKQATTTIPIVMAAVADPVGADGYRIDEGRRSSTRRPEHTCDAHHVVAQDQSRVDELTNRVEWDTRIFEERRKTNCGAY